MNIQKCLSIYSDKYYRLMFGLHQELDFESSYKKAEAFLNHYAITTESELSACHQIMHKMFTHSEKDSFFVEKDTPRNLFVEGVNLFAQISSPLFWAEHFSYIQKIGMAMGDRFFYILEEEACEADVDVAFKMKIPIDISWEELADGGFISDVVFNMFHNNYYVFGDSGKWGRWCDYENDWMDYEIFAYSEMCPAVEAYRKWCSSDNDYLSGKRMPDSLRLIKWT